MISVLRGSEIVITEDRRRWTIRRPPGSVHVVVMLECLREGAWIHVCNIQPTLEELQALAIARAEVSEPQGAAP